MNLGLIHTVHRTSIAAAGGPAAAVFACILARPWLAYCSQHSLHYNLFTSQGMPLHFSRNLGRTQQLPHTDPPLVPPTGKRWSMPKRGSASSLNSTAGRNPKDFSAPQALIAVMGMSGSGKSTFINLASGSNLGVGDGLRSCTSTVQPTPPFYLGGRRVVLVDMPGFDDTTRSDTEILETIANFLATSYKNDHLLTGILYFHRISDVRMGGISTKNFNMFKKLCGGTAFPNVVIVTNMWGGVDPQVGAAREAELMKDDLFFKFAIDNGAQMTRHAGTFSSAEKIIRSIFDNQPRPLHIQRELVDDHKDISHTSAGEELNKELNSQIRKYEEEMRALREEMREVIMENDEEARREIEAEINRAEREVTRLNRDSQKLAPNDGSNRDEWAVVAAANGVGPTQPPPKERAHGRQRRDGFKTTFLRLVNHPSGQNRKGLVRLNAGKYTPPQ